MAKEKEAAVEEVAAQPKSKKKKLFIILAAVLVLVLAAGGAAVMLLSKPTGKHEAAAVEEDKTPPIYESLESFTVNLTGGDTYLQVEVKLLLSDTDFQEKLKQRMPEIRNDILNLLSSKTPDDLSTLEGKNKLAADIQADINGLLKVRAEKGVKKVLFGSFLIQ